jgi:hypothetical protein
MAPHTEIRTELEPPVTLTTTVAIGRILAGQAYQNAVPALALGSTTAECIACVLRMQG